MGKVLIAAGSVLIALGLIVLYAPGLLSWFGRLPGDIRVEREGGTFFFPLTSMILISIVLSVLLNLWLRR